MVKAHSCLTGHFWKCLHKRPGMQNVLLESWRVCYLWRHWSSLCFLRLHSNVTSKRTLQILTFEVVFFSNGNLVIELFSFGLDGIFCSDFPGEVSGRNAVERVSPLLWKNRTKRRRASNSGEIYSEQGATEADIDSDSGYCSPKHNQASGATQRVDNTAGSSVGLLLSFSSRPNRWWFRICAVLCSLVLLWWDDLDKSKNRYVLPRYKETMRKCRVFVLWLWEHNS